MVNRQNIQEFKNEVRDSKHCTQQAIYLFVKKQNAMLLLSMI